MYSDATASEYDSAIHCWAPRPADRSRPIVGSAMLTTDASTNAIDDPRMVAIRIIRRRRTTSSGRALTESTVVIAAPRLAERVYLLSRCRHERRLRGGRGTLSVPLCGVHMPVRRHHHAARRPGGHRTRRLAAGGHGRRGDAGRLSALRRPGARDAHASVSGGSVRDAVLFDVHGNLAALD